MLTKKCIVRSLAGTAAFALLSACAAPEATQAPGPTQATPRTGGDCFDSNFVTGYESVDRDTVRLDVGVRQRYDVDLSGPQCDQIDWTHRIALESRPGSFLCAGTAPGQGTIAFRDPTIRRRVECHIDAIRHVPDTPPAAPAHP